MYSSDIKRHMTGHKCNIIKKAEGHFKMVGMQFFSVKAAAGHVMWRVFPSHVLVTVAHTITIDKITTKNK